MNIPTSPKEALRENFLTTHPNTQDHATRGYKPVAPEFYGRTAADIRARDHLVEATASVWTMSAAKLRQAADLILAAFPEGEIDWEDEDGRRSAPDSMFDSVNNRWQSHSSDSPKYTRSLLNIETTAALGTIAELVADVQYDLDFPPEEPLFDGYEVPLRDQMTNALRLARPNVQNIYSGAQENEPRVDFLDGYIIR